MICQNQRFITVLEMLNETQGNALLSSMNRLVALAAIFKERVPLADPQETARTLKVAWKQVLAELERLELYKSIGGDPDARAIRKATEDFELALFMLEEEEKPLVTAETVWTQARVLYSIIEGPLEACTLYYVDRTSAERIRNGEHEFGSTVTSKFPQACFDLDEAVKCFAFERYTASVFHLMRAMEHVVCDAIAPRLGVTSINVHGKFVGWGLAIANIRKEAEALPTTDPQRENWICIASLLWAVKECWRNDTMHIHAKYTEQEATKVYEATKVFMERLAEQLT